MLLSYFIPVVPELGAGLLWGSLKLYCLVILLLRPERISVNNGPIYKRGELQKKLGNHCFVLSSRGVRRLTHGSLGHRLVCIPWPLSNRMIVSGASWNGLQRGCTRPVI